MLYAEKQEGLVREIMCMTFSWKGAWVLPALAHTWINLTKPTLAHFCGEMAGYQSFRMDWNDEWIQWRLSKCSRMVGTCKFVSFHRRSSVKDHGLIHFQVETCQAHNYMYFKWREFRKNTCTCKKKPQRWWRYFHKCSCRWLASSPALFEWSTCTLRLKSCCSFMLPTFIILTTLWRTARDFAHQALPCFSVQHWKAGWSLGTRVV